MNNRSNENINQNSFFDFEVIKETPLGRVCKITTPNGSFFTPTFFFCATHGSLRTVGPEVLYREKTQTVLSNTFSLMPYCDIIENAGGLSKFFGWKGPTLTDSGGYQIFSLGHGSVSQEIKGVRNRESFLKKITEEGAFFNSPLNGSKIFLSPEVSIETQYKIGADFIVAFDECTPFNQSYETTKKSMERSHRWEKRSIEKFYSLYEKKTEKQKLYGVVQGGIFPDLRKISCDFVNREDFWGVAIGGSLGQNKEQMYNVTDNTIKQIEKKNRPIHLLGIGDIDDIERFIPLGIDSFDCVTPTRLARHGVAISIKEKNNKYRMLLKKSHFKNDLRPIDEDCSCHTCKTHTRSYIHYLIRRDDFLSAVLLTVHNIRQMNDLMERIRTRILNF